MVSPNVKYIPMSARGQQFTTPRRRHGLIILFFKKKTIIVLWGIQGYAAVDNPVFFKENTSMLLGDAREISGQLKSLVDKAFS